MRNALSIFMILLLLSCNDNDTTTPRSDKDSPGVKQDPQTPPTVTSTEDFETLVFNDLVYVPRDSAERMIENGRSAQCKQSQGATTYFTKGDIQQLTAIPGVTSFRLELACFGDVAGARKNRATILFVVEYSGSNQTSAPTPIYYTSRRICPPPEDCGRSVASQ